MKGNNANLCYTTFFFFVVYFCLVWIPTWLSNNLAFLLVGALYAIVVFSVATVLYKKNKDRFLLLSSGFLLLYSSYIIAIHYIFIEDPFADFYINIDEVYFFRQATILAKGSYLDIWERAFSEFSYSDAPLFHVLNGTLLKSADLKPFYSLLLLKLNIALWGSFIPGIIYLICNRIRYYKHAFKAAVIYGIFSFTFFYSLGLIRDIHIALIYSIAIYLLTGSRYNLKQYIILLLLGAAAFFIRSENGLFFGAFLGIWLLKSTSDRKLLISSVSFLGILCVFFLLGGIEIFYNQAISILQRGSERIAEEADAGSLIISLKNLPVPVNYLGVTGFGQIIPFPFWTRLSDSNSIYEIFFYFPLLVAPLFWFLVWVRIIKNLHKIKYFCRRYKYILSVSILYLLLVSIAQPLERRLMAVYPVIYMGYIFISPKIIKQKELFYASLLYISLLIVYFILKL